MGDVSEEAGCCKESSRLRLWGSDMETLTIASLAVQVRGVSYKPEDLHSSLDGSSVILLRANNIDDGKINFDDVVFVDRKKVSNEQLLRKGDILVCASSGSKNLVGKAASVDFEKEVTFGAFCKVVRPKNTEDADYLAMFFQSPVYRRKIASAAIGININNIRNEHIDALLINWPNIVKRSEMVDVLSKTVAIIQKRKQQLSVLDDLIKARFVEMFGDPEINPMCWPIKTLDTLLSIEPQNGLYKPQSDYAQDGSGTPILRIDAFYDGKVTSFLGLKRLRCSEAEKSRYLLKENDIVINRVNSLEYLGKCAWITGMVEPTVFESNMMRFHVNESEIDPCFLTRLLCSSFVYNQILNRAKKAVNQASINQSDVQSFRIIVPPRNLQTQFATFVVQIGKSKAAIQKSLGETQLLLDSLMQKYFG